MARVRIEPGGKVLIAVVIFGALLFLFFMVKGTESTKTLTSPLPAPVAESTRTKTSQPPLPAAANSQNVSEQTSEAEVPTQNIPKENQQLEKQRSIRSPIRIFFDFNRASINKNVYCIFDRIEKAVRQNGSKNLKIVVEGNADSIGPQWYNIYLSRMRAIHVADSLSKRLGVPMKNIKLVANGSSKPIASNSTRSGRAENRRTEIILYL
ncbi:MAG: OmpA family protein [Bacteroidetes bacterium]|nr:OmpA family protein [Bacteroidota bacterium]